MKNKLITFLIFACLGTTVEVYFTAFYDLVNGTVSEIDSWKLKGHSYVWMSAIYGTAALLFPLCYQRIESLSVFVRMFIYALGIFSVEFLSGGLLEIVTGTCPWKYTTGIHVMGYIRLDYFPFWMGFGLILETVYKWTNKIEKIT